MEDSVYVFAARLVDYDGVGCTIVIRSSQTLEHLHRALRRAFNWYDDHLCSFWFSGVHWDGPETEFTAPLELGETEARSAAVRLRDLELEPGLSVYIAPDRVHGQVNDGAEPLHILCALAPPPVMGDPPRFAEEA